MKNILLVLLVMSSYSIISCDSNSSIKKKTGDSAYSGLEGTQEEDSRVGGALTDTSSGQTVKKMIKDSAKAGVKNMRDSAINK